MSRKWFRFLVLLNWVLAAAALTLFYVEKRSLSPVLVCYLDARESAPLTAPGLVVFYYSLMSLCLAVVNTVGLYRFRPWARPLYLWWLVTGYALAPFIIGEATITPRLMWLPSSLNGALAGFTLALLYFSPVARYFERDSSV
ncbi:MAG TPA: hypothetical protein VF588_13730 [Pyrinomonadaceae bacterium]|jgi:hypothetical protein